MKQRLEFAERIKHLRTEERKESRDDFAKLLGVTPSAVSGWELGTYPPSADTFVRLAGLTSNPVDALYFLGMAGLQPHTILGASAKLTKEPRAPMVGEVLVIDEKTAGLAFSAGDVVVLEEIPERPKDLSASLDRVVLVNFPPRSGRKSGPMQDLWPEGLCLGRLRCKRYVYSTLQYSAMLCPLNDFDDVWRSYHEGFFIGGWTHPGPPKEPVKGSPRERAHRDVEQANARVEELISKQLGGPFRGGTVMPTEELNAARDALQAALNRLSEAETLEKAEAETEAKQQHRSQVRLYEGVEILGWVIAWYPAPAPRGEKQ